MFLDKLKESKISMSVFLIFFQRHSQILSHLIFHDIIKYKKNLFSNKYTSNKINNMAAGQENSFFCKKQTKYTLFGKPRPTKNMGVTKSLEVWLWLLFKVFFILKYIKIIFFYF